MRLFDQIKDIMTEATGARLKDLVRVRLNDPSADFWLIRKGSDTEVGKPTKEFSPEHLGITVTATNALDPNYLRFVMEHIWSQKHWVNIARGALRLKSIRKEDIENLRVGR